MNLTADQVQDWKFIGNFLVRGWVPSGPNAEDEEYIESTIRAHPKILSNRLWFMLRDDDEGEWRYFRQLIDGELSGTECVYDKSLISDPIEHAFFEVIEALWNPEVEAPMEFDRAEFMQSIIEDPEASELMFVVAANNLEVTAGCPTNSPAAFKRGIEAAMSYGDPAYQLQPPFRPGEAIG